jgi:hypothetical protein
MSENSVFFLVLGGVGLYLVMRPGGISGQTVRSDRAAANGIGPTGTNSSSLTRQIGGAALGAGCGIVASIYGTPAAGAAAAPVCAKIGSAIAPAVKEGAVYLGKETAKGAVFVGKKIGSGTVAGLRVAGNTVRGATTNPIGFSASVLEKSAGGTQTLVHATAGIMDRGLSTALGAVPAPVKLAFAPAIVASRAATKAATVAVDVGAKATSVVATGARAVGGAVSSGAKKVAGLFGF